MKVEEINSKESYSQTGVTLQRVPFETEVDVLPQLNPLEVNRTREETMPITTELMSCATEEMVKRAASYRIQDSEEEFQAIPLKRVDSGPYEHCMLMERPSTSGGVRSATHQALLDEIDDPVFPEAKEKKGASEDVDESAKAKVSKKGSTLSRMLKGMNLKSDKESACSTGDAEEGSVPHTISKIFQRMNPVRKVSMDNLNKAFHRIGDVLQKKGDERPSARPDNSRLIGGRDFKFKPTSKEAGHSSESPGTAPASK